MRIILAALFVLVLASYSLADEKALEISSSVNPSEISPGSNGYIQIDINNIGTLSVDQLKLTVLSIDSPLQVSDSYVDLGRLPAGKNNIAFIKLIVPSSTKPDFYQAELKIESCYVGQCKSYSNLVVVPVKNRGAVEIVSISPTSILIGENNTLNMKILNNDAPVNNFVLVWEDSTKMIIPFGEDNRKYIESIASGAEIDIPLKIAVDPTANTGIYPLSLKITYNDRTGTEKSYNTTLGLKVIGDFSFIVTKESQTVLAKGKAGTVEVRIANAGVQKAKFLTLKTSSENFLGINPSLVYIGNLDSDDYDTEEIELTANAEAGTYPINIEIEYRDAYGQRYVENYELDVLVLSEGAYNALQQTDSALTWVFYILVIIILYFAYKRFRKKKK